MVGMSARATEVVACWTDRPWLIRLDGALPDPTLAPVRSTSKTARVTVADFASMVHRSYVRRPPRAQPFEPGAASTLWNVTIDLTSEE
jgi:hypothetical protein